MSSDGLAKGWVPADVGFDAGAEVGLHAVEEALRHAVELVARDALEPTRGGVEGQLADLGAVDEARCAGHGL